MPFAVWCPGCDTVKVSGAKGQSARMGTFTRVSGVTRFGRPVYQHANKEYLFYWEEHKSWKIGEDYTKSHAGVASEDGGNELDAPMVPMGKWYESKGGTWQANSDITVICTSTGAHFAPVDTTLSAIFRPE